jgi:hypothetical protein
VCDCRLVNDTLEKYGRYSIPILSLKVSAIPIPILKFKSIADTDTDSDTDTCGLSEGFFSPVFGPLGSPIKVSSWQISPKCGW